MDETSAGSWGMAQTTGCLCPTMGEVEDDELSRVLTLKLVIKICI